MYIYIYYIYTHNIYKLPIRFLQLRADGQVLALGRCVAHQDAAQRGHPSRRSVTAKIDVVDQW